MIRTVSVKEAAELDTPHGVVAKRIYDSEHAQVVHVELKPGEGLKKHVTPVDVVFYVLEGTATVEIGDSCAQVTANTLAESPANGAHRIANDTDALLRFLVIKTPRPTEATMISDQH